MATRVAVSTLNASTVDIINTIRANAPLSYQNSVPEITKATDIPRVGEVIMGTPAFANEFVSLLNRIALVSVTSRTFNNPLVRLKKGYLEFGEVVEETFVNMARVREFSAEKARSREFARVLPDIRTAFHSINWKVQYPMTIEYKTLQQAFLSAEGVRNLITDIITQIYTAHDYDEYLLYKYLIIKGITKGKMYPVAFDETDMDNSAIAFRGISNAMTFPTTTYNASGVTTWTPKENQYILMDAMFNAKYDVKVLASAFNMDKADFAGKLLLIDSFTTFDNERWTEIRNAGTQVEEVTEEELTLMKDVKAILVDENWFQCYDNLLLMDTADVKSGLYWNYFYTSWKTISSSPYSNAIAFVNNDADIALPESLTVEVSEKAISEEATILTLTVENEGGLATSAYKFKQTESATAAGVAVHRYGAIIIPASATASNLTLDIEVNGVTYRSAVAVTSAFEVSDTISFNKV